ncbi:MAG: hypothetical protein QOE70_4196 [Chthoniobacter sp.]|jgi:CheY-like chemotaxis protein/phosphoribosyl 1,2-cyclic phosphodiesterase|nr:hypothetical protein [Chthoniobacter sp.]
MISSQLPPGRILIGEDTADLGYLMQVALENAGYAVDLASDGEACLLRARATHPELIMLDIMMPKMHGVDVLKALRGDPATADIGVIMCTAKDFQSDYAECMALGAIDVLMKPFETTALLDRVQTFFTNRRQAQPAPGEAPAFTAASIDRYAPKLEAALGCFSLWGTRGSIPTPGARFLRHGGNTSCMSVVVGDDQYIFDAGSGIRELGLELIHKPMRRLHLFITHTHWDHIQGFPFFTPAYLPGFQLTIYGAEGFGKDLRSLFRGQLDRDYFPVQMEDLNAAIEFRKLDTNPVLAGPAKIYWEFAQHPGATVGYKIEVGGTKIAWVPDNEFLLGFTGDPASLTRDHRVVAPFGNMIDFLSDADLVIHEAQFTNDEYPDKIRWGHSSVSNAALLMKLAGVRRWLVTHHDPAHDDLFLEEKLNLTRQILGRLDHSIQVSHAYDGLTEYL